MINNRCNNTILGTESENLYNDYLELYRDNIDNKIILSTYLSSSMHKIILDKAHNTVETEKNPDLAMIEWFEPNYYPTISA